ncbi:pyridoxamine 5'-phosphate oxidase family protein [Orrella sp. NBD-18]|uniref:Pyridoxamine 5'-phosphate oxidase family protein n=1 Tax=Sheuella amnicola TaxID=2707330 RepID=A0A6B2QUZ2_9BURK|nr:pyridoxamine 5'-phosphate oxidase family protein [Sheuella amnicola]NDY82180.1 pyridoxamine 5'-phosphate oxidase family protein [Sheuella amnicola]HBI83559.1 phosphohydrolase [Alcaligenaceae bacterium]
MHIDSLEKLRTLYGPAKERALKKQQSELDVHCRRYIELSPFVVLASSGLDKKLDASPRGGAPGFVKIVDSHTLLLPDSPGNNRLDTLENIIETGRIGMLFLIPGVDETLRVNGAAELRMDTHYLDICQTEVRRPKLVIKITVQEAYLHCAKAFMRSGLWNPDARIDRKRLPTMNQMVGEQTGLQSETEEETLKRYLTEL